MGVLFCFLCVSVALTLSAAAVVPTTENREVHRHRRQTGNGQDVFIDAIAIIAFDIYSRFYNESNKATPQERESDALAKIKTHFALLMSEADRFYQGVGSRLPYKISLQLAGFIIAQTAEASPWTEKKKQAGQSSRFLLSSPDVLSDLKVWVRDSTTLPQMDYFILFTEYDLFADTASTSNLGRAIFEGVCASSQSNTAQPGSNVAVIEHKSFSIAAISTAHELGHGLGALHDGDGNACAESDSYVMAPDTAEVTAANYGVFSDCSLTYLNSTLARLALDTQSAACIHTKITPSGVPDVTGLVPGQLYDIHRQCRLTYGNESLVCVKLTNLGDAMCSQTFCSSPGSEVCKSVSLYRGSTCGDRKWCVEDKCVSSPNAPALDESCPFGDARPPIYSTSPKTCTEYVSDFPGRCYSDYFGPQCCKSCADVKGTATGCEYGDRKKGCSSDLCSSLDATGLSDCCATCSSSNSTSSTTSTTSTISTSTTTATTTTTAATATTTTSTSTTGTTTTRSTTTSASGSGGSGNAGSGNTQAPAAVPTTRRTPATTASSGTPLMGMCRQREMLLSAAVLFLWFACGEGVFL